VETSTPSVVVIAGPNGAGKTTISREVVALLLRIGEFVNADVIAQGLSGFNPERVAMQAGRLMLARLHELADQRQEFAFETTLASRTFAPWIAELVRSGYNFVLVFVWVSSPQLSVRRVRARVRRGGHSVPDEVVVRRYARGVSNFINLYLPLATRWRVLDNSNASGPRVIAYGARDETPTVLDQAAWDRILEIAREGTSPDNR
jgi:predicted ABC-type ATPase